MYGFSMAAYISIMTWWPMGMAFIVQSIDLSAFNHTIYEYAFFWSMMGPFALNWMVPVYHAFKAMDSEDEISFESLWFPLGWTLYTVGQMIF